MPASTSSAVDRTQSVLEGRAASPNDVLSLVTELHGQREFGLARRLLEKTRQLNDVMTQPEVRLRFAQKLALSTYKDPDLPTEAKLDRALSTLASVEDLSRTTDQETLGLAGAIYKAKWAAAAVQRDLETSLGFYLRGYAQGIGRDYGYTAINAAFVLDQIAELTPLGPQEDIGRSTALRAKAREVRQHIAAALPPLLADPEHQWLGSKWWCAVTVGEAYFGLEEFEQAEHWLTLAAGTKNVSDWERESTGRQLAALMRLLARAAEDNGRAPSERAEAVLGKFLGNAAAALGSVVRGKVGLALSGGGFRASLYHIGVLAKLAELDLLRHVEYLSCVSGGSIIGAHYYLEVRKLLRDPSKNDRTITRDDYIAIVQRIERTFLAGVQRNVRTRVAAEWSTNIRMVFSPDYSRTKRAGELYESEIYSLVDDGEGDRERYLNDIMITPSDEGPDFRPKDHNWRRAAKVPILILNATTLNTGHNWQFTASWMGEPPAGIDSEVDANFRLRRMYYRDAPEPHKRMRLGYAVAASACVPGLFEPLPLRNLYQSAAPEGMKPVPPVVRLVDGGVHDNQGVAALLEQGCSVLLVSDASGQMSEQPLPSNGLLGVPLRSNSILQARIRVSQYEDLVSRRRGGLLVGLLFVHLKKGLQASPVDWLECRDPSAPVPRARLTEYGVDRNVQRRIAAIRTDLDSFSDVEAYALMASAYLMTEKSLNTASLGFEVLDQPRSAWKFLSLEPFLEDPGKATLLGQQLAVADKIAFKIWFLMRRLQVFAGVVVLLIASTLAFTVRIWSDIPLVKLEVTAGRLCLSLLFTGLTLLGLGVFTRIIQYKKTVQEILIGLGMAFFGFLFARLHLHVFDPMFLRHGSLQGLPTSGGQQRGAPPRATPPSSRRGAEVHGLASATRFPGEN